MVIAVCRQIFGGSSGGWSTFGRPSRGDREASRSGHIRPGCGPRAGQDSRWGPSVAGVGVVLDVVGGGGEAAAGGAAGVCAGPGHGEAVREVGRGGRRAGRRGGGGDGGLQRAGGLPEGLALVVLALAVVALTDIPA